MENKIQLDIPPVQSVPQTPVPPSPKWFIILLFASIELIIVAGSLFIGIQIGKKQKVDSQTTSTPQPLASTTTADNPKVSNIQSKENTNCSTNFSSKYLNLNFKYDNCYWDINEILGNSGSGGTPYTLTASNSKTENILLITGENSGMGGGYPECEKVNDITLLNGNIVRFKKENNTLLYLNEKNEFAIKGYAGKFGDAKFKEYFTLLNPEAYPDANMCWRSGGINLVSLINPPEVRNELIDGGNSYELTITINKSVPNDAFIQETDTFAVAIFSNLIK
jgi:hypothetical protein